MQKTCYLLLFLAQFAMAQFNWTTVGGLPANTDGQRFDDVFFLDENTGYAANGYFAAIYKTTNGGQTWTTILPQGALGALYFRNVEFLNENIGFLGTLSNRFYKTTDGGNTWVQVGLSPTPNAICGIDCVGTSTVYGCGAYFSPACIIKSTDSGITWQYIDMSAYATALVEILFVDENTGFVSGKNANGAVVLKTTNGGISWTTVYNGTIAGEYVWKMQLLPGNPNAVFGSIESVAPNTGKLIKSFDGGANWTVKAFPFDDDVQAVGFISATHGWMGGHDTGFYETTDGGDTWTNTGVGSNMNRIYVVNNTLAFGCGTNVYKLAQSLETNDLPEIAPVPLAVRVSPNPIRDRLNLEVDFRGADHLVLELYSVTGQLIKQLKLDLIESAGTKRYAFDFPYANGHYILNLHTNTGRQSVKITKNQ